MYADSDWIPARVGRKIGQGRTPAASEPRGVTQPPTAAKLLGAGLVAAVRLFQPGMAPAESPGLLVRDILTLYLRNAAAEGTHGSAARADREYTFKLFAEAAGDLLVADAKPYHLTDFVAAHPEWRSVSTRRAKANGIRAAFNWAFRQERIARNPFASVQYAEHERRAEMPDDALERLEKVASKQYEAVLRFLRLTGCRTGELCAATWADVDLERGIWTIQRHKSRRFTGRPKVVALVGEAVALLRQMETGAVAAVNPAKVVAEQVAVLAAKMPASAPIFINTRGTAWSAGVLAKHLRRLKQRHSISVKASLHGVRHRMLTAMMESGATPKEAAEQAGHTTSVITERYYYHRSEKMIDAMRAAAERAVPKK